MQSFIKDDKLIVNSMILDNDKEELLEFIEKSEKSKIIPTTLYNVEGDKSGIAFENGEEVDQLDITPTEEDQEFKGIFNKVDVSAIQTEEVTTDLDFSESGSISIEPQDGKYLKKVTINKSEECVPANIRLGVTIDGIEGNLYPDKPDQDKSVTPTTEKQVVRADIGYELGSVTVNSVPTQNKSVNPSTENQIVEPDPYRFLAKVTVNGVTSNIDNSIQPENIKVGASILGVNR